MVEVGETLFVPGALAGAPPLITNDVTLSPANVSVEDAPASIVLGVAVNVTPLGAGGGGGGGSTVTVIEMVASVVPPGPTACRV